MKIWVVGPVAWDSVLFLDKAHSDQSFTHIKKRVERPGGQGLNVAAGLKSAGLDVNLVSYLGKCDNSKKLSETISTLGLSTKFIASNDFAAPHVLILVDSKGERKMIGLEKSYFHDVRLPLDEISAGDMVVWTWWRDDFADDFLHCKKLGVKTVVGISALTNKNIDADLYIGNREESRDFNLPKDRVVIVTDGATGAILYQNEVEIAVSGKKIEVRDATGAGDALLAGVIVGLSRNLGMEDSIRIGVNWSSISITDDLSIPAKWSESYIELAS